MEHFYCCSKRREKVHNDIKIQILIALYFDALLRASYFFTSKPRSFSLRHSKTGIYY